MKEFLFVIAFLLIFGYILYRFFLGIVILRSERKYNKSSKIAEWWINNDPIRRFYLFGTFKKIKVEKYQYKILKDADDIEGA